MGVHDEPVDVDLELRIVTAASVWLVRPDRYMRLPRYEGPRPTPGSPALVDGTWHRHRGVWKITEQLGTRYRILPDDRPPGAVGVYTGYVVLVAFVDRCGHHYDPPNP
jgi:hypothetical protein